MTKQGWLDRLRDPSEKTLGLLLLAPAFALLALIVVYPIGRLIFNSFYDLRLSGGADAVQLKVAEKAVEAYSKVAADATTTLIVPSNMTEVSALISSAMKMVQSQKS